MIFQHINPQATFWWRKEGVMIRHATGLTILSAFLGLLLSIPQPAEAGCNITIKVKNNHNHRISLNWVAAEVKIKNGFWKSLSEAARNSKKPVDYLDPETLISRIYDADFGCGKKRQYRFKIVDHENLNEWMENYPGGNTWTTATTFTVKIKP